MKIESRQSCELDVLGLEGMFLLQEEVSGQSILRTVTRTLLQKSRQASLCTRQESRARTGSYLPATARQPLGGGRQAATGLADTGQESSTATGQPAGSHWAGRYWAGVRYSHKAEGMPILGSRQATTG